MAARTKSQKHQTVSQQQKQQQQKQKDATTAGTQQDQIEKPMSATSKHDMLIAEHLPPWTLTVIILLCSGMMLVLSLRDFWTTGKNIVGSWDEAYMMYTKSTDWYEDSKGWKSTQGGFSAIQSVSTDTNNMGGFFIRKLMGGTACAIQLHKIVPLIYHEPGAQWISGHFEPWLLTSIVANIAIATFMSTYMEDLTAAGAHYIPLATILVLMIETVTMITYLLTSRRRRQQQNRKRLPAVDLSAEGKTPSSLVSNIVSRTTFIVTSLMAVIAVRDLCFPGMILDFIPRDDIYLEWTNAFLHSPPPNSPEAQDQSLEAPLYIGDKFVSQLTAVYMLVLCLYKYVTAVGIRYGADGSGLQKARMIWKGSFFGDAAILLCFRFFAHAARSASLDTRWHLCLISYETFIFGLYAFF